MVRTLRRVAVTMAVTCIFFIPTQALAEWTALGTAVAPVPHTQNDPVAVADGSGGVIVAWIDVRNGNIDIYAQRIDVHGVPQWGAVGIPICMTIDVQIAPLIVPDGAGGAIITWFDSRVGLYAQRVNATGATQWAVDGAQLSTAAGSHNPTSMVADGTGGAFIAFVGFRGGFENVYLVHVNSAGSQTWTPDGVAVLSSAWDQFEPVIVSDGAGGVIVVWTDEQFGDLDLDLRTDRFDAAGVSVWGMRAVAQPLGNQEAPVMISDAAGGAIVAWQDGRNQAITFADIYAQRVLANGSMDWIDNGITITAELGSQVLPYLAPDGFGGAIMAWEDSGFDGADIFAQRVTQNGAQLWNNNGVLVHSSDGTVQEDPRVIPDGGGGAMIVWEDDRTINISIHGQKLDASGFASWEAAGRAIVGAAFMNSSAEVTESGGRVYLAWGDFRGPNVQARVQRVETLHGAWGHPEPEIASIADNPADQGGSAIVNWNGSDRDDIFDHDIVYYSIWRATDAASAAAFINDPELKGSTTDPSEIDADFDGVAFRTERTAAGTFFWEWIGNQSAIFSPAYSFVAPTRRDSVGGDVATHYFQVIAHTADPIIFWPSAPDSGRSVDNIAPAPAFMLTAVRIGGDNVQLDWSPSGLTEPDFGDYVIYRGETAGVPPTPIFFLSDTPDTATVDPTASASTDYYYIVTARDVHGNESAPSNEAMVGGTATGIGDRPPSLTSLQLLPNWPNPFNGTTLLGIGLPAPADVTLQVYDVAGRLVLTREIPSMDRGWQTIPFDGRDGRGRLLPSGVYFYRVNAAGATMTRKMVIGR